MKELKTKEDFSDELKIITLIHLNAKYYFKDVQYLKKPDTLEEEEASNNFFVVRVIKAFYGQGIIEIAKLFLDSKSQHYNLIDFLKNMLINFEKYSWINDLPKHLIEKWLDDLNTEEILNIRKRIAIQRDNYFAHTDSNPKISFENSIIKFFEINKLIDLTENIIFKLNEHCLDSQIELDADGMEKAGYLLEMISSFSKQRKIEAIEKWKDLIKKIKKNGA